MVNNLQCTGLHEGFAPFTVRNIYKHKHRLGRLATDFHLDTPFPEKTKPSSTPSSSVGICLLSKRGEGDVDAGFPGDATLLLF